MELARLDSLVPRGWARPAVSVGNFDGVHRGHQVLVEVAVRDARSLGGTAVVLTFDPHPSHVLSPDRAPSALMTVEQKAEVLAGLGVDKLAVLPFTPELSQETPDEFVRLVIEATLGAQLVVVGSGFRFGHRRAGDVETLERLGRERGFRVHAVEPALHEGAPISSTRIREALARGDVEAARILLGRAFFVDGTVVPGEGRGRRLGIPTANLDLVNETLPGGGVYAGRFRGLRADTGEPRPAVVNVGRRPTFGGGRVTVEAHVLDYEGDLYGRPVRLEFLVRLREERRFPGAEALVAQIRQDVARAREVLEKA
ncbi:MAG: bifunctional riboflavin kinase/FAD synthetase [Acidobacteria bacterium]|nr:bifunctional riboflavin kinase/FAD synthetase [Acidobacteriota bacterium]